MTDANLQFAWCWFVAGVISGTVHGLSFHRREYAGGYASWSRRLMRLGHISFFGTGLLNLCFALSEPSIAMSNSSAQVASMLLIIGGAAMPFVCYLAAWRQPLRFLFIVPVAALGTACGLTALATFPGLMEGGM